MLPVLIQVLASFTKADGVLLEEEIDSSLGFLRYDYPEAVYSELRQLFRQALYEQQDLAAMAQKLGLQLSAAMVVPDGEWEQVGRDAHAVIDEAKAAGVYVFGGGIDEDVPPALVSAEGAVAEGGYPWAPPLNGGFTVLELPSREEAVVWAARIAKACRCSQELRVFGFDPQS